MWTSETGMKTKREDTGEDGEQPALSDYAIIPAAFSSMRESEAAISNIPKRRNYSLWSVPSPVDIHKGYIRLFRYWGSPKELCGSKTIHVLAG